MCLAADYRVMAESAKIGLPEVKLGIYPGFGGTVRLPRLIGADNAIEWIAGGKENKAEDALKVGAVDAVVAADKLQAAALDLVKRAISGELDYKAKRQPKLEKLKLNAIEQMMAFETAKGFVAGQAGPNYPAPVEAIKTIQKAANHGRDKALEIEAAGFVKLAKTSVADSLIGLFLNDQELKSKAKGYDEAGPRREAGRCARRRHHGRRHRLPVGGQGHADPDEGYPRRGYPDGSERGLQAARQPRREGSPDAGEDGRSAERHSPDPCPTATSATSTSSSKPWSRTRRSSRSCWPKWKSKVREDAILASNTSTISINLLAKALKRPQNFVGMHFFNPVHMMPLVEVIRGEKSSEAAVATTVAYAKQMGKNPIVVNDCPGFLVNRVLFPYFGGFAKLVSAGVDFVRIDKIMEKFGWPMGPAYLMDVVGIDTAHHARDVMAEGFPERMKDDTQDRRRRPVRSQPPRSEERQGLLRLRDRQARQAEEGRRCQRSGGACADRLRTARSQPTRTSSTS